MLKLYRGLVDILIFQVHGMDDQLTQHIRGFNDGDDTDNNFGVKGFWNLLLEITFLLFVKMFIVSGFLLILGLSVVFFPLYAFRVAVVNMLNHQATPHQYEQPVPTKKEKTKQ